MEKILLIIGASGVNTATLDFATYIARLTGSKLTGLFLKNKDYDQASLISKEYKHHGTASLINHKTTKHFIDDNVRFFMEACERRGVHGDVSIMGKTLNNKTSAFEETVDETRFADLVILDAETSIKEEAEALPTSFVKKFMNETECPVILAPAECSGIGEIVFCYDASRSSVFAMKEFTHLFPQFLNKKLTVLEVENESLLSKGKEKLLEWLQKHYRDVSFQLLNGSVSNELYKYLAGKKDLFVIMGAYGRNTVSKFFRKSSADLIIRVVDVPIFISHW